jgi:restriction system protein
MARRRKNESIFEMLMEAPWWMGVTGAVIFYVMVGIVLPATLSGGPFGPILSGLCPTLGKWLAIACLFSAAISAIRSLKNRPLPSIRKAMSYMPASRVAVPAAEIDVECPQCKSVLVAPADMAGQTVTCEGCRHVFEIPKPRLKFPDATKFYFPDKPTGRFSEDLLHELEWKRFELLVEGYFAFSGWTTRPNRIGADGGVDVHLFRPDQQKAAAVVQCKAWNAYTVGVKPVRELFGVMAADGVPEGFFVTTGDYTGEARSFAAGKPMSLIDGHDLLKRLESLPAEAQADLFARVTAGDFTTPTCPQCGIKMVRREAGKGRAIGSEFWGCPKYPRCRQTFQMKKETELTDI